jgi:hypothetical protein
MHMQLYLYVYKRGSKQSNVTVMLTTRFYTIISKICKLYIAFWVSSSSVAVKIGVWWPLTVPQFDSSDYLFRYLAGTLCNSRVASRILKLILLARSPFLPCSLVTSSKGCDM